jgi:hypothetical protein
MILIDLGADEFYIHVGLVGDNRVSVGGKR